MAQRGIDQAIEQKKLDLHLWADQVLKRIILNMKREMISPFGHPGPYAGYDNRKNGAMSIRKLYARVYNDAGGNTEKITFFFSEFLNYIDMGVGVEQTFEQLRAKGRSSKKARYNRRYARWEGEGDRQQRPFLGMEFRHQIRRLQSMLLEYHTEDIQMVLVDALTKRKDMGRGTKVQPSYE